MWGEERGLESDTLGLRPGSALLGVCVVLGKCTGLFLPCLLTCEAGIRINSQRTLDMDIKFRASCPAPGSAHSHQPVDLGQRQAHVREDDPGTCHEEQSVTKGQVSL